MFLTLSHCLEKPLKSSSASGPNFFRQAFRATDFRLFCGLLRIYHAAVNYAVAFPAFTDTQQILLICIQHSVECAVSVIALDRRYNSLVVHQQEWVGAVQQMWGWVISSSCGQLGNLLRVRRTLNPTILDIRCTFTINIFRNAVFPHHSITDWQPILCCNFQTHKTLTQSIWYSKKHWL
jgi:hypothetical protein